MVLLDFAGMNVHLRGTCPHIAFKGQMGDKKLWKTSANAREMR